jgi:hypothetical protein
MMIQQPQFQPTDWLLHPPYDAAWFEMMFLAMDRLHDVVSADSPDNVSPLGPADMVEWLEEIIYTAHEAITEIRAKCEIVTEAGKNGLESEVNHVWFDLN